MGDQNSWSSTIFDLHHAQDASALERSWHYAHEVTRRVALSLQVSQYDSVMLLLPYIDFELVGCSCCG